jgi:hypothetical protein
MAVSGPGSCPKGRYSPGGADNTAVGNAGLDACIACPVGTYRAAPGATGLAGCINCDAGQGTELPSAQAPADCKPCAAGKWSVKNFNTPKEANGFGSLGCLDCPTGTSGSVALPFQK